MPDDLRSQTDRLIAYHSPISRALTAERTSLESRLIPVSAYVVTACIEALWRYPDMMAAIDAAMPAEAIGAAGRRPGSRVNTVYLWSIANFPLVGRKVTTSFDPTNDPAEPLHRILTFWERAALAFRADGTRQAWDTGTAAVYPSDVVSEIVAGTRPVDVDEVARIKRFNATLVSYLFLLYFDTRVGSGDTGPYLLPDGKVLLVRDYYHLAQSDFWWSDVAAEVPYQNLTAAFVLDGVSMRVTDFGSTYTDPEDYLDRLVSFGLFTTDPVDGKPDDADRPGPLRHLELDEMERVVAAVRPAQSAHYRRIAAMDRLDKIRCGAYVYFSFLRPFAVAAGVADQFDWSVPLLIPDEMFQMVAMLDGGNEPPDPNVEYYLPLA